MPSPDRPLAEVFLDFVRPEIERFPRPPLVDDLRALMRLAVAAWNGGTDDRDGLLTRRVEKERARLRKSWGWGEILVEFEAQLDRLAARRGEFAELGRIERVVVSRSGRKILLEVVPGEPPSFLRPSVAKRAKRTSDPASRFLRLAKAALDARPWDHLINRDVFGVEDPATGEVNWVVVNGAGGAVFGVTLYLGRGGFDFFRRAMLGEIDADESLFGQDCLLLSFVDRDELQPHDRARLRSTRVAFRGSTGWPSLESHGENRIPRAPTTAEVERMSVALEQLLVVVGRALPESGVEGSGLFGPDADGRHLVRRAAKGSGARGWFDAWEPAPEPVDRIVPHLDEIAVERLRRTTKRSEARFEVDVFPLPTVLEEPGREPFLPAMLMAVDAASGAIVAGEIGHPSEREVWAPSRLLGVFERLGYLPGVVTLRARQVRWLRPLLEALGVEVRVADRLLELERARAAHEEWLRES